MLLGENRLYKEETAGTLEHFLEEHHMLYFFCWKKSIYTYILSSVNKIIFKPGVAGHIFETIMN